MGTININGKIYSGNSINISNGKIIVDGVNVTPGNDKEINISIIGNVNQLQVDACNALDITGDVGSVDTKSGDVEINGNISGSVSTTSGDVDIDGNVTGNVNTTSGDVQCATIGSSVSSISGDIKYRKI